MANFTPADLKALRFTDKSGNVYDCDIGNVHYGVCDTAANTQTKVVSIPEIESLAEGLCVRVKFTNAQGYNGQPQLQINSLTATNIVRKGTTAAGQNEWEAGKTLDLLYDGTNFAIVGGVALSSAVDSNSEDHAATPRAVKTAYDLANGKVSCTKTNIDSALQTTTGVGKFYREDGTWGVPPGAKPIVVELDPVVGTGGSYAHTTSNTDTAEITGEMKPMCIECSDPDIFEDEIEIVTAGTGSNGSISLNCSKVKNGGVSDVTVTVMPSVAAEDGIPAQITSDEFDVLASRISDLSNAGGKIALTIPASAWPSSAPYTYTWTNSKVTARCRVEVEFASDNANNTTLYLDYDKVEGGGGVIFSAPAKPTTDTKVIVHIINVQANAYAQVPADMVSSEAVTGTSNVEDALTDVDDRITTLNSKLTPEAFTPTMNTDSVTSADVSFYQIGKIVIIGGYLTPKISGNNVGLYSNLPAAISRFATTWATEDDSICGRLYVRQNTANKQYMTARIPQSVIGKNIFFNITYISES